MYEAAYKRTIAFLTDRVQVLNAQLQDIKNCRAEADSTLANVLCFYDDEVRKVQKEGKV